MAADCLFLKPLKLASQKIDCVSKHARAKA